MCVDFSMPKRNYDKYYLRDYKALKGLQIYVIQSGVFFGGYIYMLHGVEYHQWMDGWKKVMKILTNFLVTF